MNYRHPDFSFEWNNYLKKPWRVRWRWRSLPLYYGSQFRSNYGLVNESLHWTKEQIEEYQWTRIKLLIEHAYRTVPFYQDFFREAKITPADIRSYSDYARLPVVNRKHLHDNLKDFTSSEFQKYRGFLSKTSGTTGHPLVFYRTPDVESMRQAVVWRHFNSFGYQFKQPRVSLNVIFKDDNTDLLYYYDPLENNLVLNGAFLSEEAIGEIHQLITRFRPILFYGHTSGIATLATLMKRQGLKPLGIQNVLAYSEVLAENEHRLISRFIGSNIYDYFANRENTISAPQFSCGSYHVNSEFTYLELADCPERFHGEKLYSVLGTNLWNYAMPLLRYDSGDLARSMSPCPACEIKHPTVKFIGGRWKNFLVSKQGLLHCLFDDNLHESGIELLEDYQIEQQDLENIIVRLVPSAKFNKDSDERVILDLLKSSTNNWFKINLEYRTAIPPTDGFKKAKVVSRLAYAELSRD